MPEVRIHTGEHAAASARRYGALAYTAGHDIVVADEALGAHGTRARDEIVLHEFAHVAQQATGSGAGDAARPNIQRAVAPEDVSDEMKDQTFETTDAFTSGAIQVIPGTSVVVSSWSNNAATALVHLPYPALNAGVDFDIPKRLLRPSRSSSHLAPYGAGLTSQAASLARGEATIAKEVARPGGPRPGEIPRLEALQQKRQSVLNRRLIQESMFNRLDPSIERWTAHYNTQFKFSGAAALDPNLVKSMVFQESQMGTAGANLELTPTWRVRSRFNVGQAIDSSAAALLIMLEEMDASLITKHHLADIQKDLSAARRDFQQLRGLTSRTPTQQNRFTELAAIDALARSHGVSFAETFLWNYKAAGQATGFNDAVMELFDAAPSGQPARDVDYDFWIRTMVRWLFEKRKGVKTWAEAIRAYNGSGARARHYREAVINRSTAARQAAASSTEFIPEDI